MTVREVGGRPEKNSSGTQEEIGEREGLTQKAVSLILEEMAELPKVLKPAADHLTDFDPLRFLLRSKISNYPGPLFLWSALQKTFIERDRNE